MSLGDFASEVGEAGYAAGLQEGGLSGTAVEHWTALVSLRRRAVWSGERRDSCTAAKELGRLSSSCASRSRVVSWRRFHRGCCLGENEIQEGMFTKRVVVCVCVWWWCWEGRAVRQGGIRDYDAFAVCRQGAGLRSRSRRVAGAAAAAFAVGGFRGSDRERERERGEEDDEGAGLLLWKERRMDVAGRLGEEKIEMERRFTSFSLFLVAPSVSGD